MTTLLAYIASFVLLGIIFRLAHFFDALCKTQEDLTELH